MSTTARPVRDCMVDAGACFLYAAAVVAFYFLLFPQICEEWFPGNATFPMLAAAVPYGVLVSFLLAFTISSMLEPYSRKARHMRDWLDDWVYYNVWMVGQDVVEFAIWYTRQWLKH